MPASSKKMRRAMAIALHNPEKPYRRNAGILSMTPKQMEDFARTREKGLPMKMTSGRKERRK